MAEFQLPEDRKTPIEALDFLQAVAEGLKARGDEFPIKVEGTSTLPYTSQVVELPKDQWVLKLQRALPPELMEGAPFHFIVTHESQRFEGLLAFQGRVGYLQYRFTPPRQVFLADRRRHKRHAFRPRENVFVTLHDGQIAASGPLASLSIGGLGFRVDRVVQLETHARLTVDTALFERGRAFDVRVQDLPRAPFLDLRVRLAGAYEVGGVVHLGVEFTGMQEAAEASLQAALRFREVLAKGANVSVPPKEAKGPAPRAAAEKGPEPPAPEPPSPIAPSPFLRLRRRSVQLGLLMPEGEPRESLRRALAAEGYFHLQVAADPASLPPTHLVLSPESLASQMEGALPFEPDEPAGALVRRLDSALGLRI